MGLTVEVEEPVVVPLVEEVVELQELVAEQFGCRVTPKLLGHCIPSVFSQFLLTSSTAMSTTTSPRGLSRSSISCCASKSSSGVPRMTMAFWLCTGKTLVDVITLRMAVATSLRSFCCQALVR